MTTKQAIVVGAGLVGSLWATFLARRGYAVEVYERRPDMRRAGFVGGRSINLALSTRGWKALEKAGLAEQMREHAIPMYGRMVHGPSGEQQFQPYGRQGQAIYSVSRGGLNLALIDAAERLPNVRFHFGQRCEGLSLEDYSLSFEDSLSGERRHVGGDAPIFATDGAFSAVRQALQKTNRFDYAQQYLPHGYKELSIPAGPGGSFAMAREALHIWPRGHFMLIALPNADGSFTCTLFLPFEGPESFEQLGDAAAQRRFFEQHFPDALALMPHFEQEFAENPTASLVTIRCSPWQHGGRVLLMGDASHAIVPFYGQGMNSGFEDCTVLDELVGALGEDWAQILPRFSTERVADANAIADLALQNFVEMRDLVADEGFLLRKKIAAHLTERYAGRYLPLYSMVTFSHIPYHIALREGRAQESLLHELAAIEDVLAPAQADTLARIFERWMAERQAAGVDYAALAQLAG